MTYTVTATVGDNDPKYEKDSTRTATITVTVYEAMSVTFSYVDLTETAGTEKTSSAPTWNGTAPTDVSYSITKPEGATEGNITIDASSGEVTITASAIPADSGGYTVMAIIGDNDSNYTKGSAQTATITVTVNKVALDSTSASFSYANLIENVGTEKTSPAPAWSGRTPTDVSYSIAKPAGATDDNVAIEASTGEVTITTSAISTDSGAYTVTATVGDNDPIYLKDSTQTATIKVTVNRINLGSFSYAASLITIVGKSAPSSSPMWDGGRSPTVVSYTITGPANSTSDNVTVDASGVVTATDNTVLADSGIYTVTATVGDNDPIYLKDSTQTATITVTVYEGMSVTFSYVDLTETAGTEKTSSPPTWSGTAPTSVTYSIVARPDDADSAHVTIDASSGEVTITASAISTDSGDYKVMALVGDGDPKYAKGSAQTATIKVELLKQVLQTLGATFSYTDLIESTGVEKTSPDPVWDVPGTTLTAPTDISYSMRNPLGVTDGHVTIDASNGKVTITTSATSADSGSYTVTATVGGNDPVYQENATLQATIIVTVNKVSLITNSLSYRALTVLPRQPIDHPTPQWTGRPPTDAVYSIAKPAGATDGRVTIDPSSGRVDVTPDITSVDSGNYTVTTTIGNNDPIYTANSSQTTSFTITVEKISLGENSFSYDNLSVKSGETKTSTPQWQSSFPAVTDVSYSIAKPAGATDGHVTIDASSGEVAITSSATSADSGSYTVTATAGSNDPVYTLGSTKTANIMIELGKYKMSFNVNGGDGSISEQVVDDGAKATEPAEGLTSRTGYTFAEWTNQQTGGTSFDFENTPITTDTTLFAQWAANTYTVVFNGNNGQDSDKNGKDTTHGEITPTFDSTMPLTSAVAPTRSNYEYAHFYIPDSLDGLPRSSPYVFMGYYENRDGSGAQYYDENMNPTMASWDQAEDTEIYARWEKKKYTATFNYHGGTPASGMPTSVEVQLGEPLPEFPDLLAPTSLDSGKIFAGFTYRENQDQTGGVDPSVRYYTAAGDGLPLKAGQLLWLVGADAEIYASYGASNYAREVIVYSSHNPGTRYGKVLMQADGYPSDMLRTTDPERTGYDYDSDRGYAREDGTGEATSSIKWDWAIDTVGYLKWTPKTYTVTLDTQGGSGGPGSVTATYDAEMPEGNSAPTQQGKRFVGYFTGTDDGGTQYYTNTMGSANFWKEDVSSPTLYAKWTEGNHVLVTFQYGPITKTVFGAAGASLAEPQFSPREGYTFTTWDKAIPSTIPDSDTTYAALLNAGVYTVTLDPKGGSGGTQLSATMGEALPVDGLSKPTRAGYDFHGYGRYSDGSGTKYFDADMNVQEPWDQAKDATIYADWAAQGVQITLDLDGGSGTTHTITATYDAQLPNAGLTVPKKTGYVFEGYYSERNGQGTQYFDKYFYQKALWQETGTTTIYAKWSSN